MHLTNLTAAVSTATLRYPVITCHAMLLTRTVSVRIFFFTDDLEKSLLFMN